MIAMLQINTSNASFNNAWNMLKTYHQEGTFLPGFVALDFSNMPRFKNSSNEWLKYFSFVYTLLIVGYRNGWIRTHVDGHGYPVYIALDKKYFKQV